MSPMMFRGMEPAPDGLPLVGRATRRLGVRVPEDIAPDAAEDVHPGTGGMSVAPDSMWNLPHHRRPRGMQRGSTGPVRDRVYAIALAALKQQPLDIRPSSPRHATVEPSRPMPLATYEDALTATRPSWIQAWP